jgi:hypothetical protein
MRHGGRVMRGRIGALALTLGPTVLGGCAGVSLALLRGAGGVTTGTGVSYTTFAASDGELRGPR